MIFREYRARRKGDRIGQAQSKEITPVPRPTKNLAKKRPEATKKSQVVPAQ